MLCRSQLPKLLTKSFALIIITCMKIFALKCLNKAFYLVIFTMTITGSIFAAHEQIVHGILSGNSAMVEKGFKSNKKDIEGVVHVEQAAPLCPNYVDLTPLQAAACVGDEFNVRRLIGLQANLENGGSRGSTPLMFALANKHEDLALVLMDAGARINGKSATGKTPLMIASGLGERKAVEKFLRAGADVKQTDNDGRTALLIAIDPVIARMLVAFGADTNTVDQGGVTGLHNAAISGNVAMIDFWLEAGVSVDARTRAGMTPLIAARMGEAAVAAIQASTKSQLPAGSQPPSQPKPYREAIERLTAEMNKLVIRDSNDAFAAGKEGNSAKALQLWSSAVRRAASTGPDAEDNAIASMLTYIATLPAWPGISEEAREHAVRAQYYLGKGKNVDGAIKELHLALGVAPWWADGYHDLGVIEEGRGNHDEAKRRLKIFLAMAPNDPNARAVRDKMIEIDMAKEQEGKVASMGGAWTDGKRSWTVSVRGDGMIISGNSRTFTMSMHEGMLEGTMTGDGGTVQTCSYPGQKHPATGKYDAEARTISLDSMWSIYDVHSHCVNAFGNPSNCCLFCTKVCDGATLQKNEDWHAVLHPAQK